MVQFLSHLEPIELKKGQVIFNELENVDMIIFMSEASIDLGYDINRQTKFVQRLKGAFQIGGFECTYNRRSQMIYKAQI